MIDLTKEVLAWVMPAARQRVDLFLPALDKAMKEFGISDNKRRMAAFLAQIAHESGQLRYTEEIASGSAYEGRRDLGNTQQGGGTRFKGRGLIQVTGRANYTALAAALSIDCVNNPKLLADPVNACRSAAWWWKAHGLNELADKYLFLEITKKINGGTNGLKDRQEFYIVARRLLGV